MRMSIIIVTIIFLISLSVQAQVPGETCNQAATITGLPFTITYDSSGYASSPLVGSCNSTLATEMMCDGWYVFTPVLSCNATLQMSCPTIDMILVVYTGDCNSPQEEACYYTLLSSEVIDESLYLNAGVTYYFQLGDWGTYAPGGTVTFSMDCDFGPTATPTHTPTPVAPGDNCGDTLSILPGQCVTGSTAGMTNSHDCSPSGSSHYGPDLVYELQITEENSYVIVCEADFNADFTIATVCDAVTGDILCENAFGYHVDPSCGSILHSDFGYMRWEGVLSTGTYYIWVDANGGITGNYALEIQAPATPTPTPTFCATCPPGAVQEGEPVCGDDYEDYTNGGCNWPDGSPTPGYHFMPLNCNDTVCGTSGVYDYGMDVYRDSDWYEVNITSSEFLSWTVTAGFDVSVFIIDGNGDCTDPTVIDSAIAAVCQEVTVGAVVVPGTYWLVVTPFDFSDAVCGTEYIGSVYCGPSPTPTPTPVCDVYEDFENPAFPPTGWTVETTGLGIQWEPTDILSFSGTYSVFCNYFAADHDEWLITPSVDLTQFANPEFRFSWLASYYYMVSPNDNADLVVQISTDAGTTWTPLWSEEDAGEFSTWFWYQKRISLMAYQSETDVKLAFQYIGNDAAPVFLDVVGICEGEGEPPISVPATNWLGLGALLVMGGYLLRKRSSQTKM